MPEQYPGLPSHHPQRIDRPFFLLPSLTKSDSWFWKQGPKIATSILVSSGSHIVWFLPTAVYLWRGSIQIYGGSTVPHSYQLWWCSITNVWDINNDSTRNAISLLWWSFSIRQSWRNWWGKWVTPSSTITWKTTSTTHTKGNMWQGGHRWWM